MPNNSVPNTAVVVGSTGIVGRAIATKLAETGGWRVVGATRSGGTVQGLDEAIAVETRLVVTPHFSYDSFFLPQIRLSPTEWAAFSKRYAECAAFLKADARLLFHPAQPDQFLAFLVRNRAEWGAVLEDLHAKYREPACVLTGQYAYDAHAMMAGALDDLDTSGRLMYTPPKGRSRGFLGRSDGPSTFCDNRHWRFPLGCPYGKPEEPLVTAEFLVGIAESIVRHPHATPAGAGGGSAKSARRAK